MRRFAMSSSDVTQTVSLRFGFTNATISYSRGARRQLTSLRYIKKSPVVLEIDESLIYSRFTTPPALQQLGFGLSKVFL
jgi:hypothetical protein